jgi:hypothetical protein
MEAIEAKLKAWYKSATVWLGALVVVLANAADLLPMLTALQVDPFIIRILGSAVGLAIVFVRFRGTNQAITETAAAKPVADDRTVIVHRPTKD